MKYIMYFTTTAYVYYLLSSTHVN